MPRQTGWRRPRHAECIRTGEPTQAVYECLWFRWKIFQTIDCLRRRSMCRLIVILKRNCDSHTRGLSHTTRNGTLRCCATRTSRQNLHPPWIKFWACGTEPALDLPAASLLSRLPSRRVSRRPSWTSCSTNSRRQLTLATLYFLSRLSHFSSVLSRLLNLSHVRTKGTVYETFEVAS